VTRGSIALAALALLVGLPARAAADVGGRVVGVRGDVRVETAAGVVTARVDAVVGAGEVVVTGERSSASLRLGDGSLLVLGERSRLRMTRALADAGGGRDVSVLLEVGRLVARVVRGLGVGDLFEVRTPSEHVRVHAGELYLEVAADGTTRIEPRTAEIDPDAPDDDRGRSPAPGPAAVGSTDRAPLAPSGRRGATGGTQPAQRTPAALTRVPVATLVPALVEGTSAAAHATLGDLLQASAPALSLVDGVGTSALSAVQDVLDAVSLPGAARPAALPLGPALGLRAPASGARVRGIVEFR
jgi:hypothetical protein